MGWFMTCFLGLRNFPSASCRVGSEDSSSTQHTSYAVAEHLAVSHVRWPSGFSDSP